MLPSLGTILLCVTSSVALVPVGRSCSLLGRMDNSTPYSSPGWVGAMGSWFWQRPLGDVNLDWCRWC